MKNKLHHLVETGRGAVLVMMLLALTACFTRQTPLLRPNGVAVATDGTLYVMDRGNYRVVHLNSEGQVLNTFGKLGTGAADIYSGWDIALDQARNVYICNLAQDDETADVVYDGVKVFSAEGQFQGDIGKVNYKYGDAVHKPYGVEIDAVGRVYVADFEANTVRVFSAQGAPIAQFFGAKGVGAGEFSGPLDVAVDDVRGLMYVTDSFNSRVQQFTLTESDTGELGVVHRVSIGSYGREPGEFAYPQNLTVDDASGHLYVSDMANRRIQAFNAEGNYVAEFALPGVKVWQPLGAALDANGILYVADAFNNAVWTFDKDGKMSGKIEVQP